MSIQKHDAIEHIIVTLKKKMVFVKYWIEKTTYSVWWEPLVTNDELEMWLIFFHKHALTTHHTAQLPLWNRHDIDESDVESDLTSQLSKTIRLLLCLKLKLTLISRVKYEIINARFLLKSDPWVHQNSWENWGNNLSIGRQFILKLNLVQLFDSKRVVLWSSLVIDDLSHPHDDVSFSPNVSRGLLDDLLKDALHLIQSPCSNLGVSGVLFFGGTHFSVILSFEWRLWEFTREVDEWFNRDWGCHAVSLYHSYSLILKNLVHGIQHPVVS